MNVVDIPVISDGMTQVNICLSSELPLVLPYKEQALPRSWLTCQPELLEEITGQQQVTGIGWPVHEPVYIKKRCQRSSWLSHIKKWKGCTVEY